MLELAFYFIAYLALSLIVSLIASQFVCWGLSYMHVNTGLAGPYLVLAGVSMVTAANASARHTS